MFYLRSREIQAEEKTTTQILLLHYIILGTPTFMHHLGSTLGPYVLYEEGLQREK